MAACGPPGGGRQGVTPRLLRHFTLLSMLAPSEAAMRTIFGAILGGFLATFFPPGEGGGGSSNMRLITLGLSGNPTHACSHPHHVDPAYGFLSLPW